MRYPTEAELIEMERRAERLVEQAKRSRHQAEQLMLHGGDRCRVSEIEDWADAQDRIAEDFAALVAILRIYRLGCIA